MQMTHFLTISHSVNHSHITALDNLLDPNSKGGMEIFFLNTAIYVEPSFGYIKAIA